MLSCHGGNYDKALLGMSIPVAPVMPGELIPGVIWLMADVLVPVRFLYTLSGMLSCSRPFE